jgi:nicotinate-nucleotide adenylyltransferase
MRVLCHGGSFNPIHVGHLIVARAAAEAAGFDQVLLIPSAVPPHKTADRSLASAQDRLTMCQLAVAGMAGFAVSDIELQRTEPSYTIQTARALRSLGMTEVCWLIGADTVPQLPTWREPLALLDEVKFVVAARPGYDITWDGVDLPYRFLRDSVVDTPLIDLSASQIRQRVASNQPIDFLTPPAVIDFIRSRGLYLAPSPD